MEGQTTGSEREKGSEYWEGWAEKGRQSRAGKMVAAERKRWQLK